MLCAKLHENALGELGEHAASHTGAIAAQLQDPGSIGVLGASRVERYYIGSGSNKEIMSQSGCATPARRSLAAGAAPSPEVPLVSGS